MTSFYHTTNDIAVLRERIAELSRIRTGFCAHLGSSLYKDIDRDNDLYWGRESLFEGIATCDAERQRILDRIEALTKEDAVTPQVMQATQEEELPLEVTREMPRITNVETKADAIVEDDFTQTPMTDEPTIGEVANEPYEVGEPAIETDSSEDGDPAKSDAMEGEEAPFSQTIEVVDEVESDEVETPDDPRQNTMPEGDSTVVVSPSVDIEVGSVVSSHQVAIDATNYENAISSMPIVDADIPHTCAKCGNPVGEGDKFCMNCGSPILNAPQSTCPNCGSVISSDYMFCMICGQRLK